MNMVKTKNKLEQGFVDHFDPAATDLPGAPSVRKGALARFEATGLPHRRIEEWKYTDLRNMIDEAPKPVAASDQSAAVSEQDLNAALGPLADLDAHRIVFVDGHHCPKFDDLKTDGVDIVPLRASLEANSDGADALLSDSETLFRGSAVVDLNTAFVSDGAVIKISDGTQLDKPVLIVHLAAADVPRTTTVRHRLTCGAGAEATVVEAFVRAAKAHDGSLTNTVSEVRTGDQSTLHHIKVLKDGTNHLANWHVTLGEKTNYRAFHLTAGADVARSDGLIQFKGEHSALDFSGAFLGNDKDHIDTTLVIEHLVPHCESRELFKGVLDGSARGIFQGKVLVTQDAQKTDGKQMAQALMLSPDVEFDSKPELEIYADDVLCGHGSTSAEIDDDLLFYLRSRGIPEDQARALLIDSFVGEALDAVEHEGVRTALSSLAGTWLEQL